MKNRDGSAEKLKELLMNIPKHYKVSDNIVGDVQLLTRGRAAASGLQ